MRFTQFVRRLHKWLGLLIGIQVLLWVSGGLIMSSFPLERVHGDHTREAPDADPLDPKTLIALGEFFARQASPSQRLTLYQGYDGPHIRLTSAEGEVSYFRADTGELLTPIGSELAARIASTHYSGPGEVARSIRVTDTSTEYRGPVPAWAVTFDDWENTTLYLEESSGRVLASRNTMWRIFDFFWMLHIMDYEEREDFNHPLLILAAASALLFSVTGLYLLTRSFRRSDFGLKPKSSR